MPIPDFQTLMLPVLRAVEDGGEHSLAEIRQRVAGALRLGEEDLVEKLKNGTSLFANRVAWSVMYLRKAETITPVKKGVYRITNRGQALLAERLPKVTVKTLVQFPEMAQFLKERVSGQEASPQVVPERISTETPEEQLDNSFQALRDALRMLPTSCEADVRYGNDRTNSRYSKIRDACALPFTWFRQFSSNVKKCIESSQR